MSQSRPDDAMKTNELLLALRGPGPSWLRHRGAAAGLDRLLLRGATRAELEACRESYENHIQHLQSEHGLAVERPSVDNGQRFRLRLA